MIPPRAYTRDNLAEFLRGRGINPTRQRIEIALVLFSRCAHMSADEVLAIVNERNSETSKATVYNTLKLFLEKKLIREVIVDSRKIFYDPNTSPHHHFYNVDTGELTDIDVTELAVLEMPLPPESAVVEGVDIVIRTRSSRAT